MMLLGVVVLAGAGVTGSLLSLVLHASPSLVVIVTCLSIPALTLLFYIGYMVRCEPTVTSYLAPLRALAVLSVAMSGTIVLDLVLSERDTQMTVEAKVLSGQMSILHMGSYRQPVDAQHFKTVKEGDVVAVRTTPVFRRIESISMLDAPSPGFRRSREDNAVMIVAAGVFFLAAGVFIFRPREGNRPGNMPGFFLLVVPSYILSLIAAGLWIKLLLVHVLKAIDKV
jgi:hypothetical protein